MSEKNMNAPHSRYYDIACKLSSIVGTWPYLKPKTKLFRNSLVVIAVVTILIPQAGYQYICGMGLQCTAENLSGVLLSFVVPLMLYTFQSNTRTIKILTEHLFSDWEELKSPKENEIMRSYAVNNRRFCLLYSAYLFLTTALYMIVSLVPVILNIVLPLNESRPVMAPYASYYFVDTQEYFFQIFLHSFVSWYFYSITILAHDCMFISYIEHICSLFDVIGYRLEHLFCNETMQTVDTDSHNEYCKKIASVVDTHGKVIEMAQLVQNVFNIPYAIQMVLVTIAISIAMLQITTMNNDILDLIKYISNILIQLLHLLMLSNEGQKLIDGSLQIRNRIYNSYWYNVSVQSQKLIIMVMVKSLRPSILSACKIYIFSLQGFVTIVQASMSYFAMLSSFQ